MILNRLGNKSRIAKDIICHFPKHRIYIEPFFGAGGIFFSKRKAECNILNDLDSDVFNLFNVIIGGKDEFKKAFYLMPIHSDLLNYWKSNKEIDPIKKALRFVLLSNVSFLGVGKGIKYGSGENHKKDIYLYLEDVYSMINDVQFMNTDFRNVIDSISWKKDRNDKEKTFMYADPPYLGTNDNYSQSFTENDTIDLFDVCVKSGVPFAISEFDHPSVLELAKHHNLEVITIGERQNLKNRRTEILVVNYESPALYSLFRNEAQSLLLV